ncbi:MAG: hypothetical protein RQ728_04405 [Brevefilum sp.]|nr:hypothetical protein [Brevefilum sp.]MDT8381478.1 hypothetical protein [Brevefilum sp.]
MREKLQNLGFTYFSTPKSYLNTQLTEWLHAIRNLGASSIIFQSDFTRAIPEDPFLIANEYGLSPIVHFVSELPKAKDFNNASILLDVYAKRGANKVILGSKPNVRSAWPSSGWQFENLVDQFLDRFIPLAHYAVQIGMKPILPPLQPGGDYWDTSFIARVFSGLKSRQVDNVLNQLIISSFGHTFGKPLSWGKGGPERWSGSKPYNTPEGQEDQKGFNNFEWYQSIAERALMRPVPAIILEAGFTGSTTKQESPERTIETIRIILQALSKDQHKRNSIDEIKFNRLLQGCFFSLDKLKTSMQGELSVQGFYKLFGAPETEKSAQIFDLDKQKIISHYLLLPTHANSISDAILNKVRPVIKKYRPTVGFSLVEASFAEKVSIYPDPILFPEEVINQLRRAGCKVEILPDSGIEIATMLQGS